MENKEIPRFVLFNSPLYRNTYDDGETYLPPLGQGYIITNLKKHGIDAQLVDCVHLRLGVNEIINYINSGSFRHIGFNVFSINMSLIKEIISGINREVQLYLGGKVIEHVWQEILTWKCEKPITFIIGEGELIFPDLVKGECQESPFYDDGLNRVFSVKKDSHYFPIDINTLQLDRSIFRGREVVNHYGQIESCMIASRECIYNCAFCGGARSLNPNTIPRVRSNDSLKQEICDIISLCPRVSSIRMLDDLFLRNRSSIINAIELFSSFSSLYWRCMAHINSFVNNLDLAHQLRESGCEEVFVGIESGSQEIRNLINKQGSVDDVISVVTALLSAGIDVKGYFMGGFPGETEEQLNQTVQLSKRLDQISKNTLGCFRATAFRFRPYHGTELYNQIYKTQTINYYHDQVFPGSKKQYSFSAGNFSKMSDSILDELLHSIGQ